MLMPSPACRPPWRLDREGGRVPGQGMLVAPRPTFAGEQDAREGGWQARGLSSPVYGLRGPGRAPQARWASGSSSVTWEQQ